MAYLFTFIAGFCFGILATVFFVGVVGLMVEAGVKEELKKKNGKA